MCLVRAAVFVSREFAARPGTSIESAGEVYPPHAFIPADMFLPVTCSFRATCTCSATVPGRACAPHRGQGLARHVGQVMLIDAEVRSRPGRCSPGSESMDRATRSCRFPQRTARACRPCGCLKNDTGIPVLAEYCRGASGQSDDEGYVQSNARRRSTEALAANGAEALGGRFIQACDPKHRWYGRFAAGHALAVRTVDGRSDPACLVVRGLKSHRLKAFRRDELDLPSRR